MRWGFVLMCGLVLTNVGCGKRAAPAPKSVPSPVAKSGKTIEPGPPKSVPVEAKKDEFKKPPSVGIGRRYEGLEVQNMLKQLFIATRNFEAERNKFPASREELEPYYEKNGKINEALNDGYVVYLWKAKKQVDNPDQTILAWEGQADTQGNRYVLMVNGDTPLMGKADFEKAPKAPVKK